MVLLEVMRTSMNSMDTYVPGRTVRFVLQASCFRQCLGRRHVRGVVRSLGGFSFRRGEGGPEQPAAYVNYLHSHSHMYQPAQSVQC